MKKLKNILLIAVAAAMLISIFTSCNDKRSKTDEELYNNGIEMIQLMKEMATNDSYLMLNSTESLSHELSPVQYGDYTEPEAVYSFTISESQIAAEYESIDKMSKELKNAIVSKFISDFAARINAIYSNAATLAASSICVVNRTFVTDGRIEPILYVYIYSDAPAVIVSFIPGEENSVLAKGMFILSESLRTEEDILEHFEEFNPKKVK